VPGGEKRQRKRSGFGEADGVGEGDEVLERHPHEFGVSAVALRPQHVITQAIVVAAVEARFTAAARHARLKHHAAPGRHAVVRARCDLAGDVRAEDVGKRELHPLDAAPVPDVEMIQGTRADADDSVAALQLGIRRILVTEHFWRSVLVKPDSLHAALNTIGSPRLSVPSEGATRS
jgi:hypothetical protein